MANITEVSQWENVIRQLENGEAATGGADGLANIQAKQLANRTQWLKDNYFPKSGGFFGGNIWKTNTLSIGVNGGDKDPVMNIFPESISTDAAGGFEFISQNNTNKNVVIFKPDGAILSILNESTIRDIAGSAIVAKSVGEIGYVKYASGLIIQWGNVGNPNKLTGIEVKFPTTFNHNVICTITPKEATYTGANRGKSFLMCNVTLSSFKIEMPEAVTYFNYIAIGW